MAKKAVGKNNPAASELLGSAMQRWRRLAAERDTADIARATLDVLVEFAERDGAAPLTLEPPLLDPRVWFVQALKDNPHQPPESKAAYARRLHRLMLAAPVTRQWKQKTILRRSFD